jgi:hypothetical protein
VACGRRHHRLHPLLQLQLPALLQTLQLQARQQRHPQDQQAQALPLLQDYPAGRTAAYPLL